MLASNETFSVRIRPELRKELDGLVVIMDRSRSWLVVKAIEQYLDIQRWQAEVIRQRLTEAEAGEGTTIPHKVVMKRSEERLRKKTRIMNIVWRAQAESDLFALVDYIALDDPRAALRVYKTICTAVTRLAAFLKSGKSGRVERTRELVVPGLPYTIVYTIIEEEVQILTVHHTSRKWPESFPSEQ